MGNRYADWMRQAEAGVGHARNALACGDGEWACFAAQQGAEKAVKALFLSRSFEVRGHTLTALLRGETERIIWLGSWVTAFPSAWTSFPIPGQSSTGFGRSLRGGMGRSRGAGICRFRAGPGKNGRRLIPETLGDCPCRLPGYRERLALWHRSDNDPLLARLDEIREGF